MTAPKRLARANDIASREPVRQCVGCRTRAHKRQLLRFVRGGDGEWVLDRAARRDGRGAYLCSAQCAERVKKNKRYKGLAGVTVVPDAWPNKTT